MLPRLCLALGLWEASFLPEYFYLRFRDFNSIPSLWEAWFHLEHSCLRFCDFNLAPSL
jgi:hypothetical protein